MARRALRSSAPSPERVKTKCTAVYRLGCSSRRVPRTLTSSACNVTRCCSRIDTTSDAEQVAAATSNSSTGDVATTPSPSTRTVGRPAGPASKSRRSRHRIVISGAGFAMSVAAPRGQPDVHAIVAEPIHGVILEQPVECGAVVELEADHEVDPQRRAIGIGAAGAVPGQAEAAAGVWRRGLLVARESVQRLEAADVAVLGVEEADLAGGPDSKTGRKQIAGVERDAEDHLRVPGEVDPAARAESEQTQLRAVVSAPRDRG